MNDSTKANRRALRPFSDARPLDDLDYAILELLQEDAERTDADLARRVGLSASGLKKRLKKLKERGVIRKRVTLLDRHRVDLGLLCFVQVALTHHEPGTAQNLREAVARIPEVLECHFTTGEHDYLLKVVARNHRHLEHILATRLAAISGVDRLLTSIVLNEVKRTTVLPLAIDYEADGENGEAAEAAGP